MKALLVIAALLLAAPPVGALAQERGDQGQAHAGRLVPLSRVLAMIAQRTPGRHLNTTQGESGGRPAYFVQWQTPEGRVVVFVVDAESGQIIGRQGG
ncbi:MAG: hypothetical protein ABI655_05105 [Phenylobacterium sp.]